MYKSISLPSCYRLAPVAGCFFLVLFAACHRHAQPVQVTAPPPPPPVAPVFDPVKEEVGHPANVVASLEKTPCFGTCPAFKWRMEETETGALVAYWEGIRYVDRLGKYQAAVPASWLQDLLAQAERTGFFKSEHRYPVNGKGIPDLPITIIYLRSGDLRHQVRDNGDSPLNLQAFEKIFSENLERLDWKKVGQ